MDEYLARGEYQNTRMSGNFRFSPSLDHFLLGGTINAAMVRGLLRGGKLLYVAFQRDCSHISLWSLQREGTGSKIQGIYGGIAFPLDLERSHWIRTPDAEFSQFLLEHDISSGYPCYIQLSKGIVDPEGIRSDEKSLSLVPA